MITHIPFLFSKESSMPPKVTPVEWPEDTGLKTRLQSFPRKVKGANSLIFFIKQEIIFTNDLDYFISRKVFMQQLNEFCCEYNLYIPCSPQVGWILKYAGIKSRSISARGKQNVVYYGLVCAGDHE